MPIAKPFLGETHDRDKAFPGINALTVTVSQDPFGYYLTHPWQRESLYTETTIPRNTGCCNPRCQQGGIDLQQLVRHSGDGEYELPCSGHEGSPKGRRRGDPCDNRFKITVSIEKKQREPTASAPAATGRIVRRPEGAGD